MALREDQLHFILFPLMAQGHMIPMLDIARLLAQRSILVTFVTTPLNYLRFKSNIDRSIQSDLPLRLLQLYFPSVEAGLPQGCENLENVPSRDMAKNFFQAISMLQQPLEQSMEEMEPSPSCIISDYCLPWTMKTALKFNIPRFIFHGMSCFSLLCCQNILEHKPHEAVNSASDSITIPGLPDQVEIAKSCLPDKFSRPSTDTGDLHHRIHEAERSAYGVVVNSFYELEHKYIDKYHKSNDQKAWCIGPVSLYNKNIYDVSERGKKASIEGTQCLKWLDSKRRETVIYVCLGSLCRLTASQLKEIGLGLEETKLAFIWVIRDDEKYQVLHKWFCEQGFLERNKDRCLIIKGWAPQVLILSHPAIGGFLTHCGWNSTLEGICAGVPMITWPMFWEQFLNEKLIVQIFGIGIQVGVSKPVPWGEEDNVGVLVQKEDVENAVNRLMDNHDEGITRRRKAKELADMAHKAMQEGGSSHLCMTLLIEDIKHQARNKGSAHNGENVERQCKHQNSREAS